MEANAATLFPTRFEFRYSVGEMLSVHNERSRGHARLVDSGRVWLRLIVLMFLVSGLALLAQALGAFDQRAVPAVATLLSLAFIAGLYSAWMEANGTAKRAITMLSAEGAFGPRHVVVSDAAFEATARGYAVRLDLASVRDVAIDDAFVVMVVDETLQFLLPRRCLGDGESVGAFKRHVDARRAVRPPSP